MTKRFIVSIDFSPHSEQLLTFSYNWATLAGAELLLLHHATELLPGLGESEVLASLKRDSEERGLIKLRSFTEALVGPDPRIKYYAHSYPVSSALIKLQQLDITDYLFVSLSDKNWIERLMMLSTNLQLTEQTNSIIIGLPTAISDFQFDTLHVAVKQKYPLNTSRFEELLSVTSDKIKYITFFSVINKGADRNEITVYLKEICSRYNRRAAVSYTISEASNASTGIKEYMSAHKGILVTQKGPRNFMDFFRSFFTTEVIKYAQIPVVILP